MLLLYFKSFHIIGMVVWFSGLFYLGRLFVYHKEVEELQKSECEAFKMQYSKMEKRLYYGIAWPGLCITIIFGLGMLSEWGMPNWIKFKLALAFLLAGYHLWCGNVRKKLLENNCGWSGKNLRLFNEIPTILLVGIVLIVVFKDAILWPVFLIIIISLALIIFFTVNLFSKRKK
tara:strand:- start:901 stop:1422 length:522 start_codon:yes stop_codon:yes gene_type:complete